MNDEQVVEVESSRFKNFLLLLREKLILPGKIGGVLTFVYLFCPLIFFVFARENFTSAKYALVMVCVGYLFLVIPKVALDGISIPRAKSFYWSLGVFMLGVGLSFIFAPNKSFAFFGAYHRFVPSLSFFIAWCVLLIITIANVSKERLNVLLNILLCSQAVNVASGILQSYGISHYSPIEALDYIRVPGLLGNANFTSMYIASLTPLAVIKALGNTNRRGKFFSWAYVFLVLWSLSLYTSRGAVLGAAIGVAVAFVLVCIRYILKRKAETGKYLAPIVSFAIVGVMFASMAWAYVNVSRPGSVAISEGNVSSRLLAWNAAFEMFFAHPLAGVGLGNFEDVFTLTRPQYIGGLDYLYDDAHNLFLHLATEGGIFVIGGFLLLLYFSIRLAMKSYFKDGNLVQVSLVAGIITWMVIASFTPVEIANWVLLAALISGIWVYEPLREWKMPKQLWSAVGLKLAGVLFVVCGLIVGVSEPLMELAVQRYGYRDIRGSYNSGRNAEFVNPFNYVGSLNKIASEIRLDVNAAVVDSHIREMKDSYIGNFRAQANAGVLYYRLYVRTNNELYLNKAIETLKYAESLNPTDKLVNGILAQIYFKKGEVQKAREIAISNLVTAKTRATDFESWVLLSRIYRDEGRREQMLFTLEKVYLLDPTNLRYKQFLNIVRELPGTDQVDLPIDFDPKFFY